MSANRALVVRDLVVVLVKILFCRLARRRTHTGLSRVGRNRDQHFAHVIGVVGFRELVADLVSIGIDLLQEPARLARRGGKGWVHGNANDIVPRRNNWLAIAAVKDKKLPV